MQRIQVGFPAPTSDDSRSPGSGDLIPSGLQGPLHLDILRREHWLKKQM